MMYDEIEATIVSRISNLPSFAGSLPRGTGPTALAVSMALATTGLPSTEVVVIKPGETTYASVAAISLEKTALTTVDKTVT